MALVRTKPKRHISHAVFQKILEEAPKVLTDSSYVWIIGLLLWNMEIMINLFVISKVKYTEIDWKAYMQEVEGFLNGTYDYTELKGDTGPLVYPAGFVYIYSILYYATSQGQNIRLAQYLFFIFYLINLYLVFRIYSKTRLCPPYVLIFLSCTSYRIHSLFVLRLFNDPVAMLIFFLALNFFIDKRWYLGSLFFSIAVSVKMNVLLFAPALLIIYLTELGIFKAIINLAICATIQVLFALPFLFTNPSGYILRSFDIGRQFFHIWTVNWRFLSVEMFADRRFHAALLICHLLLLFVFAAWRWKRNFFHLFQLVSFSKRWKKGERILSSNEIVLALFTSNFIGMCFSRSLHYQFYVWYYHTLPYLLWSTSYPTPVRLLLFGLIELSWNTYPSTHLSSSCLHLCHLLLLIGLWRRKGAVLDEDAGKVDESSFGKKQD